MLKTCPDNYEQNKNNLAESVKPFSSGVVTHNMQYLIDFYL